MFLSLPCCNSGLNVWKSPTNSTRNLTSLVYNWKKWHSLVKKLCVVLAWGGRINGPEQRCAQRPSSLHCYCVTWGQKYIIWPLNCPHEWLNNLSRAYEITSSDPNVITMTSTCFCTNSSQSFFSHFQFLRVLKMTCMHACYAHVIIAEPVHNWLWHHCFKLL